MSGFHIDAFFEEISKKNTQGNQMITHDKFELPEHDCLYEGTNAQGYIDVEPAYRKSTVLRLIEADRQGRGGPAFAWYDPTTGLFTRNKDDPDSGIPTGSCLWPLYREAPTLHNSDSGAPNAEPDYKQLFEQMCERCDALDAKLAEYSERKPVGYIMPTALKQLKAGGHAVVGGVSQGFDVPIYTAPQPAEPVDVDHGETRMNTGAEAEKSNVFGGVVDHGEAEPVKVPSNTDIDELSREWGLQSAAYPSKSMVRDFARALLARYTTTKEQP